MHILILPALTLCWQQVGLEQKLLLRKGASVEGTTPTGCIKSSQSTGCFVRCYLRFLLVAKYTIDICTTLNKIQTFLIEFISRTIIVS
jgi:hypothetical protein